MIKYLAMVGLLCCTFLLATANASEDSDSRFEMLQQQIDAQATAIRQLQSAQYSKSATLSRLPPIDEAESSSSAHTVEAATESRLERLERSVLGFDLNQRDFLESMSTLSRRTLNGRLHLDHWAFPKDSPGINTIESGDPTGDPQDRFQIRRARIGIRGEVPPSNVSYRAEFEFSGANGAQVRDAWLGWDDVPWANTVRLGNQKRPYGLDHLNSSNFNVFLERPSVVDALNENNRRLGLVSYGVSDDLSCNWRYGVFNAMPIQTQNTIRGDKSRNTKTTRSTKVLRRHLVHAVSFTAGQPTRMTRPNSPAGDASASRRSKTLVR